MRISAHVVLHSSVFLFFSAFFLHRLLGLRAFYPFLRGYSRTNRISQWRKRHMTIENRLERDSELRTKNAMWRKKHPRITSTIPTGRKYDVKGGGGGVKKKREEHTSTERVVELRFVKELSSRKKETNQRQKKGEIWVTMVLEKNKIAIFFLPYLYVYRTCRFFFLASVEKSEMY